jgi:hypothetical protein
MKTAVRCILVILAMVELCSPLLHAQATLLLEEPYSYDSAFAGTGHTAVYLSRICAASPVRLRRCRQGELGAVISRYHGLAGHDWIAIPLIPYLYAVEKPRDIPLYANPALVAFLRHEYLPHLKDIATRDSMEGEPVGPWYELIGSAYDRTLYGFQMATTPEQDDALIKKLNSSPNREAYNLLRRNCADFSKDIINFYYPKATHRSIIADLGVTTPKQVAKTLVHYSKRHSNTEMTSFIIPQVPGMKRSTRIHGVLESALFSKKYMAVLFFLHPLAIGGVETAYVAKWHFDPAHNAMMFDVGRGIEAPLSAEERRSYQEKLDDLLASSDRVETSPKWTEFEDNATPQLDSTGCPMLQRDTNGDPVQVRLCREGALRSDFPELVEQLISFRLNTELKGGKPARASQQQIENDMRLLQRVVAAEPTELAGEMQP